MGLVGFLMLTQVACAHPIAGLKRGDDLTPLTVETLAAGIPKGSVVVLGENHGLATHRDQQVAVLQALRGAGHIVSVGLEFFPAEFQAQVDAWRGGAQTEAEFLKAIGWGNPSFDFYRLQASFPSLEEGAQTVALNASRNLTSRVAKVGLEGLTSGERALLPPGFQLGRDSYRARFAAQMPHLPDPSALDRYFAAQSVWDEAMAWHATEFLRAHPGQTLVIVVGEFHARYGGGLPDRLRARGAPNVFVISQVNLHGLSPQEALDEIAPTADGPRGDAVWAEEAGGAL